MMIQEFIDRTNYAPSPDEYRHIESAYYDFDGTKDDFCKWWKKAKRAGYWDRELELRRRNESAIQESRDKLNESRENVEFYRPYFDRAYNAELLLQLTSSMAPANLVVWYKDGRKEKFDCVAVKYIPKSYNGKFDFVNLVTTSNWITSIKMSDIDRLFLH